MTPTPPQGLELAKLIAKRHSHMKDFIKNIVAAFVGVAIFSVVALFVTMIGLVGMAASLGTTTPTSIADGSVLVVSLDGDMSERNPKPSPMEYIMGKDNGGMGLAETLSAIRKAKDNDKVKGIYVEAGNLGGYLAQLQELRNALESFKKSGKWIVAYGDSYTTGAYYVASVADELYVNPIGEINWQGIGSAQPYLKNVLAKIGVKMIPIKCGKYKSATEIYTEDHMSEPSREQTERYVNGWWNTICKAVSKSRGVSVDKLNDYADRLVTLEDTKNLVKYNMVDGLLYSDQIKDVVKKRLGLGEDDNVPQVTVADMETVSEKHEGDVVAVYYASGDIVDEAPEQSLITGADLIIGNDMVSDINSLADDDNVKAVVLRVNSPGGSAYASEQIWHAIDLLKKKKPVVVSMGGAAASGGYYISSGANYIFAEPNTITGSIGIYGIVADRSELLTKKIGISYDGVKTNRNSLMGSTAIPMTQEQLNLIQASVNNGYRLFKSRVAKGRNLSMERVEEIAQGHVYLGSDALALSLVDDLGGLDKAINKAARLAKLEKYHAVDYPEAEGFLSRLLDDKAGGSYLDARLRLALGDLYEPLMMVQKLENMGRVQARMPISVPLR